MREGRSVQTEQNRTNVVPTFVLSPPANHAAVWGELWPMTSRTQLPIEVLPNQTERGTPAPQPQPASPLPVTRLGPQHAFLCAILLRATPQTPQSRSQPGASGTRAATPPEVSRPVPVLPDSTSSALPWHPIPNPIPFQPSPGPVWSLSCSRSPRQVGAIYGRSGWIDEGFFPARTPSPPYLGT